MALSYDIIIEFLYPILPQSKLDFTIIDISLMLPVNCMCIVFHVTIIIHSSISILLSLFPLPYPCHEAEL